MARLPRSDVFDPEEVAIAHITQRCVRRCFLMGHDPVTRRDYDHRKRWLEKRLRRFAGCFGIDLICYAILSNHFHLILRSRPDIVALWDDTEVARRWLTICPTRKDKRGNPLEPSETDLDWIRNDAERLSTIRRRLSDFSWWMRLLSQPLAAMANKEEDQQGRFWQGRFRAVRVCDEASLLACAAYVDLNVIRAGRAETLERSDFTSVQKRIESIMPRRQQPGQPAADCFLTPVAINEQHGDTSPAPSRTRYRASDKGFLPISAIQYLETLDWTARQVAPGKVGVTPGDVPNVFDRIGLGVAEWTDMVRHFGRLFYLAAGLPETLGNLRTRKTKRVFHVRRRFRTLFQARAA